MPERIYVIDSTAFYAGIPFQGEGQYYTTHLVLEEITHQNVASPLIHSRVHVMAPSNEYLAQVRRSAIDTGDSGSMSDADFSLIALALELSKGSEVSLVSDDFAVRNVASALGIALSETAISSGWEAKKWKIYCKGCGMEYTNPKILTCIVCGTKLSRKPEGIPKTQSG